STRVAIVHLHLWYKTRRLPPSRNQGRIKREPQIAINILRPGLFVLAGLFPAKAASDTVYKYWGSSRPPLLAPPPPAHPYTPG
ncbi:hypothetical protein J6590_044721, partial [Homalodisca vitripennis]